MQKAIAKYGLAAHLALLAVAPLFLFPFFGDAVAATVMLWLSLPAAVWTFVQPSVRWGEMLHEARARVASAVFRDPCFWVMLVVVVFSGVRALNTGIAMKYDAETSKWFVESAMMPLLPASVGGEGYLPFAASLACMVVVTACRHALGRSARQSYFLVSSMLAGVAAATALVLANLGNAVAAAAVKCPQRTLSFVGTAFAIHFIGGLVATAGAVESKWNRAVPLLMLSVGGTAAGAFAFAPAYVSGISAVAWLLVFAYAFFYMLRVIRGAAEFKLVILLSLSLVVGCMLAVATMPGPVLSARLAAFADKSFFPDWYADARKAVSAIAVKAWMSTPWTGTGVGSFGLDMRFNAEPADWALIPRGLVAPPLGWAKLLAERGIAGAAMMALPLIMLLVTYVRRLVGWLFVRSAPQPGCWAAPAAVLAVAATGFFDCSYLRADVLVAAAGMMALSASSFPKAEKGVKNG